MTRTVVRRTVLAILALPALAACADIPSSPTSARAAAGSAADIGRLLANTPWGRQAATQGPPILVGAGDIARCYDENPLVITPPEQTAAEATAELLRQIPGTVFAAGDNAYEHGSTYDYETCYDPTWGSEKDRTRPSPGNHEYLSLAEGYLAYFGAAAHPPGYYYSYELGSWHVVVLNSTTQWALCPPRSYDSELPDPASPVSPEEGRSCVGDVPQKLWLLADLEAHPTECTVAYFHHPRFSSGKHGSQYEMQQFWDILYEKGVDVVISAHDHLYERFAPQDPEGRLRRKRGIRQFTVGTGGAELYPFTTVLPNSEVRNNDTHGVLALGLGDGGYAWAFIPVEGGTFRDSGADACH
jgi:hypothetical protein